MKQEATIQIKDLKLDLIDRMNQINTRIDQAKAELNTRIDQTKTELIDRMNRLEVGLIDRMNRSQLQTILWVVEVGVVQLVAKYLFHM